ncbi:subtilisin family serine protease [Stackebrandtia albiflava]|uniref:Subtilisin family serine protease n=1 Tax=Stackebrandtia albiflava TaxID=406432 RepID=A0A562VC90_9ACTN|nr:S8 family serine peptidase [Stackebrandtia albiflava]TWJ15486.1 subtilisin family serine protease [Stackebrandtia albiflava]
MSPVRLRRRFGLCAVAAVITVAVLPVPATADPGPDPSATDPGDVAWPASLPDTADVTLVTGDRVEVRTNADGRTAVTVTPVNGSGVFHTRTDPDGELYVYPADVGRHVADGLLDPELFNVTGLVRDGYDDAGTDSVPVIVDYRGEPSVKTLTARTAELPGTEPAAPLTSLGASATRVEKDDAADFYETLTDDSRVERVWLDRKIRIRLDDSVPLIGAPVAWESGLDGTGVTVAVLDTGYDVNHPDLADAVVGAKSFIEGETVQDGNGHGTHVAGTVAGSGAASDGTHTGVAPGADLLIGKVLDDTGSGLLSGAVVGAEWAIAQGADVISMSLGAKTAHASDPISEAVDALSEETGVLFVIAAGNEGQNILGSPGVASRALTVGATDDHDVVADFSSRGPRADGVLKPEISAPGVGIVAPRAAGTAMGTPVDEYYTSANGTSMATPHVAGAAAILAQQHPEWRAGELKDALVSTSRTLWDQSLHDVGSGRLDVAAAVTAQVHATGVAEFGTVTVDDGTREETVTYTNSGDTDVTLDLSLDMGRDLEVLPGAVSVSAESVTVPAGGTAEVVVGLDATLDEYGVYGGNLVATGGDSVISTAIHYVKEVPRQAVTVEVLNRRGEAPTEAEIILFELTGKARVAAQAQLFDGSAHTFQVPAGDYAVAVRIVQKDQIFGFGQDTDYYFEPEVPVTGDLTLTADAREAVDISARVEGERRRLQGESIVVLGHREREDGVGVTFGHIASTAGSDAVYGAIPSRTTAVHGTFSFSADIGLATPTYTGELRVGRERSTLPLVTDQLMDRFDGKRQYIAMPVGAGEDADYEGTDVTGALVVITAGFDMAKVDRAAANGASAVMFARDDDAAPLDLLYLGAAKIPVLGAPYGTSAALREAAATGRPFGVTVEGHLDESVGYLVPLDVSGAVPSDLTVEVDRRDFAELENDVRASGDSQVTVEALHTWRDGQTDSYQVTTFGYAPSERSEHLYAAGMTYQQYLGTTLSAGPSLYDVPRGYRAGHEYESDWFHGPLVPGGDPASACAFCRTDDTIGFDVVPVTDGDTGHFGSAPTSVTYHRDGVQVPGVESLAVPGTAEYRVDAVTVPYTSPAAPLWTRIDTSWTFVSGAPGTGTIDGCGEVFEDPAGCAALPVILTGFDMDLDAHNSARADKRFRFDLLTDRAAGFTGDPDVAGVSVEVSYDDGETWVGADKVKHDRRGGEHAVTVAHPDVSATNGFVSLRIAVWDDAGNRTEQTVIRAYALR